MSVFVSQEHSPISAYFLGYLNHNVNTSMIWGTYVDCAMFITKLDVTLILSASNTHWMCNRMATDHLS